MTNHQAADAVEDEPEEIEGQGSPDDEALGEYPQRSIYCCVTAICR